jgi:glycosyltransferase involved in cell wall biosynthesis
MLFFKRKDFDIIHSSGPDSLFANVNTFHFCQNTRKELLKNGVIRFKVKGLKTLLRKIHMILYAYIVTFVEKIVSKRRKFFVAIPVSNLLKNELIAAYGISESSMRMIPNGVNLDEFKSGNIQLYRNEIRKEINISPEAFVYLFVGGDWERKGLSHFLTAFSNTHEENDIGLIVGYGDEKQFKSICRELNIADKVVFTGPSSEIKKFYAASDVFVFPTLYDTFGIAPLEAMATGLPVIVSKKAGVCEIIEHKKNGLLINDPSDISEMEGAMSILKNDASLRHRVSKHALTTSKSESWNDICKMVSNCYEELLKSSINNNRSHKQKISS